MKTHALALTVAAAALLALGACNNEQRRPTRRRTRRRRKPQKAAGDQDDRRRARAERQVHGRGQGRRPRPDARRPGPYTVFVPDDAAFDQAPGGNVRHQSQEPRAADRHHHQPDSARHGARRRHRQGDRQGQGQGRRSRRWAAERSPRPRTAARPSSPIPPATRRRSPRATSNSPTASSITSMRVLMPAKQPAANAPAVGKKAGK